MCSNIFIFQCLTNQTGGKPKISPQLAVMAGFHSHQCCLRNFHRQHWCLENQLSQLFGVKFWVFYWFDLVWLCTKKLRYVLKKIFHYRDFARKITIMEVNKCSLVNLKFAKPQFVIFLDTIIPIIENLL